MPYIGNVLTSFAVETGNINDQAVTAPKLSATGGTDGQVLALDSNLNLEWVSDPAGQWVTSGSNIYYNDGNVGIGVANPARELSIGDGSGSPNIQFLASSAGNSRIEFGDSDDSDAGEIQYVHSSNYMQFTTNGSERLRIDSSGKVGIGTTSPSSDLDVFNTGFVNLKVRSSGTNTAALNLINSTRNYSINSSGGALTFYDATAGSERARIDSSGRLLIGTSTPSGSSNLQVAGKIGTLGTDSAFGTDSIPTIYRSGSTAGSYPFDNFGHLIIQPRADGAPRDVIFATGNGGANKTVIDNSGNVGIGTTSPSAKLHVTGTTRLGANDATDAILEIGAGATGNRNAFIDLTGDTTYSDYGLRIQRDNSGANTTSRLLHRGNW